MCLILGTMHFSSAFRPNAGEITSVRFVQDSASMYTNPNALREEEAGNYADRAVRDITIEDPKIIAAVADALQDNLDAHTANKNNPHGVTAKQAGAAERNFLQQIVAGTASAGRLCTAGGSAFTCRRGAPWPAASALRRRCAFAPSRWKAPCPPTWPPSFREKSVKAFAKSCAKPCLCGCRVYN